MDTVQATVDFCKPKAQSVYYFVEDLMLALRFRNCLVGRAYLRDCLVQVCLYDKLTVNLTDEIYPVIAKRYSTTVANVCKAIRHCLITCFNDGNLKLVNRIFHCNIVGNTPPTNAEFITTMAILVKRYLSLRNNDSSSVTYFQLQ